MTLTEYLESLPADPTDASSPSLIVAEGMLTPAQRKQVVGDTYARRPFAVVAGLPRSRPMRLHNHRARYSGGVDVFLHHPSDTLGKAPDGEALAHLQALLARAGDSVTEIRTGYALASRLHVTTEIDPRPATLDALDGLQAVTRFTYHLWR